MEKILCMNVAAQLAAGTLANLPDNLPLDIDIKDQNVRAQNLMQWELFRIFYHGVVAALGDDQNWPKPAAGQIGLGGILGSLGSLVPGGLGKLPELAGPILAPLIQQILDKLKPAAPALPSPLPNPGQPAPKP